MRKTSLKIVISWFPFQPSLPEENNNLDLGLPLSDSTVREICTPLRVLKQTSTPADPRGVEDMTPLHRGTANYRIRTKGEDDLLLLLKLQSNQTTSKTMDKSDYELKCEAYIFC